ncbi:kinase-like domain-containing protein [Kockovaella imperatae]|uniref:Kinase-like domain-containing protein n=1 Tax=Kockovaella imperatae TaxID=4999 RepID=A0A1Y1UHZ5_9TREE|nr:kinase-like domain-containing protein [Kockovaella imperatae]ORX37157.1 kinase-like domain-containing protein [Kockovaella imperatae]
MTDDLNEELISKTDHSLVVVQTQVDGQKIVVKRSLLVTDTTRERWKSEVETLRLASGHPNVIALLDYDSDLLSLSFKYEHGSSLDQLVDSDQQCQLDSSSVGNLELQTVDALAFLHERSIIHDDIKPQNILWSTQTRKATLIDFGAAMLPPWTFTASGTPNYVSPEFWNRQKDPKNDVWALGITLLFGYRHVPLPDGEWILPHTFEPGPARDGLQSWFNHVAEVRSRAAENGHEVVAWMLEPDIEARPTSKEILARLKKA